MNKVVFRISPDVTNQTFQSGDLVFGAAPFDTPMYVVVTLEKQRLTAEFSYSFGADEPTMTETLDREITVHVGRTSGRIMKLDFPVEHFEQSLASAAEDLHIRQRKLTQAAGTNEPLRKAANYGLVSSMLPSMNDFIAKEALPELRRVTAR